MIKSAIIFFHQISITSSFNFIRSCSPVLRQTFEKSGIFRSCSIRGGLSPGISFHDLFLLRWVLFKILS